MISSPIAPKDFRNQSNVCEIIPCATVRDQGLRIRALYYLPAEGIRSGPNDYGTGDLQHAIDDAGHEAVIKPKPLITPGGPWVHRRRARGDGGLPGRSYPTAQRYGWPASVRTAATARYCSGLLAEYVVERDGLQVAAANE